MPSRLRLLYICCCVLQGLCAFGLDRLDAGATRLVLKVVAMGLLIAIAAIAQQTRQLIFWLVFGLFAWILLPRIFS